MLLLFYLLSQGRTCKRAQAHDGTGSLWLPDTSTYAGKALRDRDPSGDCEVLTFVPKAPNRCMHARANHTEPVNTLGISPEWHAASELSRQSAGQTADFTYAYKYKPSIAG